MREFTGSEIWMEQGGVCLVRSRTTVCVCGNITVRGHYVGTPHTSTNSISISATFLQMQTVVCYITKHTPPCSLWISLPVISCNNWSPSLPFTHLNVNGLGHHTTLPYGLGILRAASHRVTTQMTYFTICLFQLTTCLFHIPHSILVLLFFYLTRLVSLVTYLFETHMNTLR